jgi:hypothetical protein
MYTGPFISNLRLSEEYVRMFPDSHFSVTNARAILDSHGIRPYPPRMFALWVNIQNITLTMFEMVNDTLDNYICDWEYENNFDSIWIFYRFKAIMESMDRSHQLWPTIQSTYMRLYDMQRKIQGIEKEITRWSKIM